MKAMAILVTCLLAGALPAAQVAGYGRDGTRIYPDCTPPVKWTLDDVRWEAPLPGYNTGSPIVVANKVFAMCEPAPGFDFPLLVCLDAATGEELWRDEVDHLAVTGLPPAKQEEIRRAWHEWLENFYERQRLKQGYIDGDAETRKIMQEKGYEWLSKRGEKTGRRAFVVHGKATEKAWKAKLKLATEAGLVTNVSQHGYGCGLGVGMAMGTPCSDGETVYVATAFGSVAAYDLDGKQRWIGWAKGEIKTEGCLHGRSPILWDPPDGQGPKLVISDKAHLVRAFERDTGKLLWTGKITNSHTIVSPAVLTVPVGDGGKTAQVLWTAGAQAWTLPDGKPLKVDGWKEEAMQVLVKHDEPDVAFFTGAGEHSGWTGKGRIGSKGCKYGSPAAVRFKLVGDTLEATVLWHGGTIAELNPEQARRGVGGGNTPHLVYQDGKLYHKEGAIIEALTGKIIKGRINRYGKVQAAPATGHILAIAGGHVYGLQKARSKTKGQVSRAAVCEVYTLDGKRVAANPVERRADGPETRAWLKACTGKEDWQFSYGLGFTFGGERIFFRSLTSIICIGK